MKREINKSFLGAAIILLLGGCAARHPAPFRRPAVVPGGIYHQVKKGETLWRIARTYEVELEELARANRIPDAARIGVGQLIFIPGAKEILKIPPAGKSVGGGKGFIWPLKGKITSFFGSENDGFANSGLSIRAKEGEKVLAVRDGRVAFVGQNLGGWGKVVIIDHGDGFLTVYAHNYRILVEPGQEVEQGKPIALAGASGKPSEPRLYFEIRQRDKPLNPLYFLPH